MTDNHLTRRTLAWVVLGLLLCVDLVVIVPLVRQESTILGEGTGDRQNVLALEGAAPAVTWLRNNTTADVVLLAPMPLKEPLRDALQGRRVVGYDEAEAARRGDLLILAMSDKEVPARIQQLTRMSPRVAVFPAGVEVRALLGRGSATKEREAQRRAGRQLVRRINIRLTPRAWPTLAAGNVDARLMGLLNQLSTNHSFDVSDFPRDAAERRANAPALRMTITAVDGRLVAEAAAHDLKEMSALLRSLRSPYRPHEVKLERGDLALHVRFLLPRPRLNPAAPP